ncbi:MAG TPA: hypothetical protein VNH65_08115 [Candidatus Acidoferrum sp.]|nr:hypothetical protein [Candidatus Acidoferrum sp.]
MHILPTPHLCTIVITANIDTDITILTTVQRSNRGQDQKGEAAWLPLLLICCVVSEAR